MLISAQKKVRFWMKRDTKHILFVNKNREEKEKKDKGKKLASAWSQSLDLLPEGRSTICCAKYANVT